jgi:hypothetical protein
LNLIPTIDLKSRRNKMVKKLIWTILPVEMKITNLKVIEAHLVIQRVKVTRMMRGKREKKPKRRRKRNKKHREKRNSLGTKLFSNNFRGF